MSVRLRAKARRDLDDILAYSLVRHGEETAKAYLRAVGDAIGRLATYPEFGAPCPDLAPTLRSLPVREHRVYYVVNKRGVSVARVLDKAMDAGRQM